MSMKALITAALLLGTVSSAAAESSLLKAQARLQRSIEKKGPVEGFLEHVTSDVAYLHPDEEIITGRDATRTFLKTAYPHPKRVQQILHAITGDDSADGRVGFTIGWIEETSDTNETTYGKFIAAWKKSDGTWRVQGYLRIASPGPPSPVPDDALIVDGVRGVRDPGLVAAHRLDIAIADSQFADLSIANGYTEAFPIYAADAAAVVAYPDFFWNRAGVEVAFAGWTPDQTLSWYPLRAEAAASGDLGWSIGHGTFKIGEDRNYSKYLTVWIRTANGWRWLLDGGSPRPAPAP